MSPGRPIVVTGNRNPVDLRSSVARYSPVAAAPAGATIFVVGFSVNVWPGVVTIEDGSGTTSGGGCGAAVAMGANSSAARPDTARHTSFRIIAAGYRRARGVGNPPTDRSPVHVLERMLAR